ncbi:hypothetical protein ACOMHN_033515 [Nucella lapillus]
MLLSAFLPPETGRSVQEELRIEMENQGQNDAPEAKNRNEQSDRRTKIMCGREQRMKLKERMTPQEMRAELEGEREGCIR